MKLKGAFLAIAASGAFLLVAACGGGVDSDSNSGDGKTATPGSGGTGGNGNTGGTGSTGSSDTVATLPSPTNSSTGCGGGGCRPARACRPNTQTTVIDGDLFVAEQGAVGVTLLSDGGVSLSQYAFTLMYDNVSGIRTSNPQDKWGTAVLFPPGTPVGTSNQVQLLAPTYFGFILYGPVPSSFPKGIPVQLIMRSYGGTRQDVWATASLGKDIPSNHFTDLHDTSVTYGLNNTATVTFLGTTGAGLSVALTNVCGSGLPSSEYRYCGDGAGLQWPC